MSLIGTWQTRILRLIESRERVWGESVLGCPAAGMGQSQARLSPLRYPAPAYGAGVWLPGGYSSGMAKNAEARIGTCNSQPKNPGPNQLIGV